MTADSSAHPNDRSAADVPALSVRDIQRRLATELSRRARIGHLLLLLLNLTIAIGAASLLLTEPALLLRTKVAFVGMIIIALSWAAFAWWTLTRRQVLLAGHEIVAGRMAVVFCAVLVAGSLGLVWAGPSAPAALMSAGLGAALLAVAWMMLRRARQRFDVLVRRRAELERALQDPGKSRS
jgi:hypothetical protein